MLDWHPITLDDCDWMRQKLREEPREECEYGIANIFAYSAAIDLFVADNYGCFVTKCIFGDYNAYCFPIGGGNKDAAIRDVIAEIRESGIESEIYGMNETDAAILEAAFPGAFNIQKERDSFDYVYLRDDLVNLAGKKYQSKRNHISFFERNCRWRYETITRETIPECIAMSEEWLRENTNEFQDDLEQELVIIKKAFSAYEALGCVGGLLRVDGVVVAYTFGEKMTDDMFCVHFEKAFSSIRGAYPMINKQFVLHELGDYRYINREDDVGHDNLRKAKESYHPALFVEKYETRIN